MAPVVGKENLVDDFDNVRIKVSFFLTCFFNTIIV